MLLKINYIQETNLFVIMYKNLVHVAEFDTFAEAHEFMKSRTQSLIHRYTLIPQ
jgi:hypothetical protein